MHVFMGGMYYLFYSYALGDLKLYFLPHDYSLQYSRFLSHPNNSRFLEHVELTTTRVGKPNMTCLLQNPLWNLRGRREDARMARNHFAGLL